jgi:hypothetical protein
MQLHYDDATHTYTEDGQRLVSITQAIASGGLTDSNWYNELATWRGSVVHACCEYDDQGDLLESTVPVDAKGYLAAWRSARTQLGVKFTEIEQARMHPIYRYAGRPDRIGVLPNGDRVVIELKTGSSARWHAIQTAAQANFFPEPRTFRRFSVILSGDGTFSMHEYTKASFSADWQCFQACLSIHNWRVINGISSY